MEKLIKDKELSKKLGENAKIKAIKSFSKEKYYDNIIKVYKGVIKKVN